MVGLGDLCGALLALHLNEGLVDVGNGRAEGSLTLALCSQQACAVGPHLRQPTRHEQGKLTNYRNADLQMRRNHFNTRHSDKQCMPDAEEWGVGGLG